MAYFPRDPLAKRCISGEQCLQSVLIDEDTILGGQYFAFGLRAVARFLALSFRPVTLAMASNLLLLLEPVFNVEYRDS